MEAPFDFSAMEGLIQKAMKDDTGELSKLINDLIMAGRKAGHTGMSLHEIASVVTSCGGDVIMTSPQHKNGTSRVAEAVNNIDCSHVILVQGDEPLLLPSHIDQIVSSIKTNLDTQAWNATAPITDANDLDRHSFVKCVVNQSNRIIYCFRRSPCYSPPDIQSLFIRKILGLIAFRKDFLLTFDSFAPSPIERYESIEQMRIIDNYIPFLSVPVSTALPSVNEPLDVDVLLKYAHTHPEQIALMQDIKSLV